jgi:hypothetical protein
VALDAAWADAVALDAAWADAVALDAAWADTTAAVADDVAECALRIGAGPAEVLAMSGSFVVVWAGMSFAAGASKSFPAIRFCCPD